MSQSAACGILSDTVCVGAVCNSTSGCGPLFCSYNVTSTPNCLYGWSDFSDSKTFLCKTSPTSGVCQRCPPGWTASGAYCVECQLGWSCDAAGVPLCEGQCASGSWPTCDPSTGYATCTQCSSNATALGLQKRILTRGGVLDAPELCEAYFQCQTGYYLTSTSDKTQLTCLPCTIPERNPGQWTMRSQGLTFGDAFSCMYAAEETLNASNALGAYGDLQTSCPEGGFTSRPKAAATVAGCVACPNAPTGGHFASGRFDCTTECGGQYVRRGEACVHSDRSLIKCDGDGCDGSHMPWNDPGSMVVSRPQWAVAAETAVVEAADLSGGVSAAGTLYLSGIALCDKIKATIDLGYVQDKPLFALTCSDTESHRFYLLCKGARYVYAFLERSFGSNNRFVMWQVDTGSSLQGRVLQTWRLPGKVCSATWSMLDGVEYVYAVFCGEPFVFYVKVADTFLNTSYKSAGVTWVTGGGTSLFIGRQYGILIGGSVPGLADGQRDVAQFGSSLSVCNTSDPRRLLVADQANCRLVEIIVDTPGSFLTRATSIGEALCYTSDQPLPSPRLLTSVLGGRWALFLTDAGLMQMDAATRTVQTAVSTEEMPLAGVRWIGATGQGARIVLHNGTHSAQASAGQAPCPDHYASQRGGACAPCPRTSYAAGPACVPCSSPLCGAGTALVPCGAGSDAHCRTCSLPDSSRTPYAFRFDGNCTVVPTSPCPSGFYAVRNVSGSDCAQCPVWYGPSAYDGVPQWGVCSCFPQGTMRQGVCEVAAPSMAAGFIPAWAQGMNCTYQECQEQGCYLSKAFPRTCTGCPPGQYSAGGMWCKACSGFRTPTPARDECVCIRPSLPNGLLGLRDYEECVCPAGHASGGAEGCAPCAPGLYQAEQAPVSTQRSCSACPAGTESQAGATACTACEEGMYKEEGMTGCVGCASPTAFASNATSGASCSDCTASCPPGQRWMPCPGSQAGMFTCAPCAVELGATQEFVPGGDNRECWWQCLSGHYEDTSECWPCTADACPPGSVFIPCTGYTDRVCSPTCVNSTMPSENAVWSAGCEWDCAPGFALQQTQVVAWTEYACV